MIAYLKAASIPIAILLGIFSGQQWIENMAFFYIWFVCLVGVGIIFLAYVVVGEDEEKKSELAEKLREVDREVSPKVRMAFTICSAVVLVGAGWFLTAILIALVSLITRTIRALMLGEIND